MDYSSFKVVKDGKKLQYWNNVLTFKLPQSSQTFYWLVIFFFAISSQIPRIPNLTLYIVYYIMIFIVKNNYIPWNCPTCTIHVNTEVFFNRIKINKSHCLHTIIKNLTVHCFFNLTKRFVLSNSFVNLATVFVKLTSRSIPLLCS